MLIFFIFVTGKHKVIYATVILGMHFLLAAGFMLYFFHVPEHGDNNVVPTTTVAAIVPNPKNDIPTLNHTA